MSDDLFVTETVTKRGRPSLGKRAMTAKERQRRHRKQVKHQAKRDQREARERSLAAATIAAAGNFGRKVYAVIYADPPWRFEPYSRETGMDRAADNHYPTMKLAEIKAMAVPAATDCALFLWATVPLLVEALDVMRAWGFTYKSERIWLKTTRGTGYWTRNEVEHLLIGVRGNVPAPVMGDQPSQVVESPRTAHSEKPDIFADDIERLFPTVPKLEMFARKIRPGWDCWGNEAGTA